MSIVAEHLAKQQLWQEYVANLLCLSVRPKYETKISMYSDLIAPQPPKMTGEQVKKHILKRLTGGKKVS